MNGRTSSFNNIASLLIRSLLVCLVLWQADLRASAAPASATVGSIDSCRYADAAAAQNAWKSLWGTAPAEVTTVDGSNVLRLPCNFKGTTIERASWDRTVALDLTTCRGIEFQLSCRDTSPVSHFSLYLESGAGWYHATFFPESVTAWNTISLDKAAFGTEGKPAGWGKIQTIRLSAWRGKDASTELRLRDVRKTGELGADALVAIVRGESVAQRDPDEARSVNQFTETMAQMFERLDVGSAVVSDLDLSPDRLKRAKVVILPHNPSLPDPAVEALLAYTQGGGKLMAFYSIPPKLQQVLKVQGGQHVQEPRPGFFSTIRFQDQALPGAPRSVGQHSWNINSLQPIPGASRILAEWLDDNGQPSGHAAILGSTNGLVMTHVLLGDDAENKRRMLLAMVGYLAPEIWQQAVQAGIRRVGVIGGCKDLEESTAAVRRTAQKDSPALQALSSARELRDKAVTALARRDFAGALDHAAAAQQRLKEAWCLAQPALPGEFRAFWCHSAFGVQGMDWDEAIGRLAKNGFTAILPNMLWGGVAYYDSKLLPVSSEVAKRGDQIAQCVAACRKHGVQIHVWKVNWNLGHAVRKELVQKLAGEGRLQADVRGKEEPWLCPSHPENQKLEIDSMLEVARNYDVDGIHFDYIRYPDGNHCFCAGCKERFQRAASVTVQNWPKDLLANGPLRQQWLDWRRGNITTVVKAVAEQAHALKPKLKVSAAVFRNWTSDRDSVGQDWKLWCDRGWMDFVCPMDYTASHRQFENMVTQQVEWAGRVPCYPGIGESASSSRLGVDGVIEQIQITRRHKTGGFTIFNYGVTEAKDLVPLLGLGITAKR